MFHQLLHSKGPGFVFCIHSRTILGSGLFSDFAGQKLIALRRPSLHLPPMTKNLMHPNISSEQQFHLVSSFEPCGSQPQAIEKLNSGLKSGREVSKPCWGSQAPERPTPWPMSSRNVQKPTLVIAHNKTLADQLYNEFKEFFPENRVEYFVSYYDYYQPESYIPSKDQYIEKDSHINPKIEQMRLATTASLLSRQDVIVVASVSCIYGLGNPENFQKMGFELKVGDRISRKEILGKLVDILFERSDLDLSPGHFRVEG